MPKVLRKVLLVTHGQSNINNHLTITNANALKKVYGGVDIFMVAVGTFNNGIAEIVKVASYPPEPYLFRVRDIV